MAIRLATNDYLYFYLFKYLFIYIFSQCYTLIADYFSRLSENPLVYKIAENSGKCRSQSLKVQVQL